MNKQGVVFKYNETNLYADVYKIAIEKEYTEAYYWGILLSEKIFNNVKSELLTECKEMAEAMLSDPEEYYDRFDDLENANYNGDYEYYYNYT